jgi:hypothetical protein
LACPVDQCEALGREADGLLCFYRLVEISLKAPIK